MPRFSSSNKNFGYKHVGAKPGAKTYSPSSSVQERLPKKVDLRQHMTPVEDQGDANSCAANAIAGAYEYLLKKHYDETIDISRLFVYYNARLRDESESEDEGSVIQYGIESLEKFGACREDVWPYDLDKVCSKPNRNAYSDAKQFKTLNYEQVPVKLEAWKQCLADGYPIVFGAVLFDSFDECEEDDGVVPMPHKAEVVRGEHGGHAMLCVGYSDVDEVFIVRNSWGEEWGDEGYCYMPYNYLMSKKLNYDDCWIIRSIDNLPEPESTWSDDDSSVFKNEKDREVNRFSTDYYDEFEKLFLNKDGSSNEYTPLLEGARWLLDSVSSFFGDSTEEAENEENTDDGAYEEDSADEEVYAEDEDAEVDEDEADEEEYEEDEDAEVDEDEADEEEYEEDEDAEVEEDEADEEEYEEDEDAEVDEDEADEEEYEEDEDAEVEEERNKSRRDKAHKKIRD